MVKYIFILNCVFLAVGPLVFYFLNSDKLYYPFLIFSLTYWPQVQGSPVALLQSPCEGQERVILWVSSMTWAVVCVCDGTVPTLSTAGPAAALESTVRYTAAAWVPWRPSAFVLGSRDGGIHVWDLLADTSRAVYKQKFGVLEIVGKRYAVNEQGWRCEANAIAKMQ